MPPKTTRAGFTLTESIAVLSVLAVLAGVLGPRLQDHLRARRDQRRLADLEELQRAIEQYHTDRGEYPAVEGGPDSSWDDSHVGTFIPSLVREGYLDAPASDPVNDARYHYEYFRYDVSATCPAAAGNSSGHYYVLRIKGFEDAAFATAHDSELSCGSTDWKAGYAYVLGGGAVLQ